MSRVGDRMTPEDTGSAAQKAKQDDLKDYENPIADEWVKQAVGLVDPAKWEAHETKYPKLSKTEFLLLREQNPSAGAELYEDGSSYIKIHDGRILFLHEISQALGSGINSYDGTSLVEAAANAPAEIDKSLRQAYDNYQERLDWQVIAPFSLQLGPKAAQIAASNRAAAILFTILHEYGHAALHKAGPRDPKAEEPEADQWAAETLFELFAAPTDQENSALSGAFLSIRAQAARERILKIIPKTYPKSEDRFANVIRIAQGFLGSELMFYVKTTQVFSTDCRLQSCEHALDADVPFPPSTVAQIVSGVVARLVHIGQGNPIDERMGKDLAFIASNALPEVLSEVAATLRRILSKAQAENEADAETRRSLVAVYPKLLAVVPERFRFSYGGD